MIRLRDPNDPAGLSRLIRLRDPNDPAGLSRLINRQIDAALETECAEQKVRDYLGASAQSIGGFGRLSWPTGRFHLVEGARRGNHGLTTARDPGNVG